MNSAIRPATPTASWSKSCSGSHDEPELAPLTDTRQGHSLAIARDIVSAHLTGLLLTVANTQTPRRERGTQPWQPTTTRRCRRGKIVVFRPITGSQGPARSKAKSGIL